jgi:hypothetical protein
VLLLSSHSSSNHQPRHHGPSAWPRTAPAQAAVAKRCCLPDGAAARSLRTRLAAQRGASPGSALAACADQQRARRAGLRGACGGGWARGGAWQGLHSQQLAHQGSLLCAAPGGVAAGVNVCALVRPSAQCLGACTAAGMRDQDGKGFRDGNGGRIGGCMSFGLLRCDGMQLSVRFWRRAGLPGHRPGPTVTSAG